MPYDMPPNGLAQLATRPCNQRTTRIHQLDILEQWAVQAGLTEFALLQRNRSLDIDIGISQVNEHIGLLLLQRSVRVDQVGVDGAAFQGLETVAHPPLGIVVDFVLNQVDDRQP
ncbi:hypothetical protein [Bifidobacterium xylocopae]|uniref:Uncharacterized protein n=1 Tax=Bifidobacterium xylocopae TaxID=2493119 RepID=A0A366KCV4_9BIFI|nr:hypothetical protein [Bifidobacterium xylocopae]RBP99008.1 hypothetical protein CRD59_05930 [Bifidobacterium xylocopae]